jgi:hypothetical protein
MGGGAFGFGLRVVGLWDSGKWAMQAEAGEGWPVVAVIKPFRGVASADVALAGKAAQRTTGFSQPFDYFSSFLGS